MYDLHIHTTASDGQYSPSQIINLAFEKGISLLAITDHDSISGVTEGQAAAAKRGISFIPGIEISVKGAREMHILGYGIDITHQGAVEMCTKFQQLRDERKYRILDFLQKRGVCLTLEEVEKQAGSSLIARPHFAKAMVEAGYVSTTREAFERFLGIPDFDRVERPKPTPEEGIEMIHRIGGIAVLAHPSTLKLDASALEEQLKVLLSYGLDGMECHYSSFSPEASKGYIDLAKKYGLMITGGSDFHGETVKPEISLGEFWGNTLYQDGLEIYQRVFS